MKRAERTVVRDRSLDVEAYCLRGAVGAFPTHFHSYYVLGLVERGRRRMTCRGKSWTIGPGDVLLFRPGDPHACVQGETETLEYRGLNVPPEVLEERMGAPLFFRASVVRDPALGAALQALHTGVMEGGPRELASLGRALRRHACAKGKEDACREEVAAACAYMEAHYSQRLTVQAIGREAGMSPSTLLRSFVRCKGVTPHVYLENVRLAAARRLLEQGVPPAQAALETGFSDQSHFTHRFTRVLGLTPGAYRDGVWKGGLHGKN